MSISSWDKEHVKNIERYASLIDKIYQSAAQEAAALTGVISHFDKTKSFSFANYPETKRRVEKLLRKLQKEVKFVVLDGIESSWTLSNNKNNELCNVVFGDNKGKLTKEQERKYYATNDKARKAFELRKTAGLSLSERVWKYSDQFKQEIEMGLDIGLRDGLSAQEISRELKQYLRNPNKLFRRVRDEHGVLHLSKQAKAFHPGQGVYRSSYKNAMRLARTEVNMAYRTADHIRWQQLDFVVGIEIRLSNNHTLNGVPFTDICDDLKGKYPKDFKFTGWHPQCRCHAVTILKSPTEMKADTQRILNGENPTVESKNRVGDVPKAYSRWITNNKDRIERSSSLPYFVRDNEKYIRQMRITNAAAKGVLEAQALNEEIIPFVMSPDGIDALKNDRWFVNVDGNYGLSAEEIARNYNDSPISGFDLKQFSDEMSDIFKDEDIMASMKKVSILNEGVRFTMVWKLEGGDKIELVRLFRTVDGRKDADHEFFTLPERMQGKGVSKKVFRALYKQYIKARVETMSVYANIDVGGYTWARYGFRTHVKEASNLINLLFDHGSITKQTHSDAISTINEFANKNKGEMFPVNLLAEKRYGRELLLNRSWHGKLDLTDESQRLAFEKYLFR